MRLNEFEKGAVSNVRKQYGDVVESLPAIAGLARGTGMVARKAAQATARGASKLAGAVKQTVGSSGPNATVGTQGPTGGGTSGGTSSVSATSSKMGAGQTQQGGIAQKAADKALQQVSNKLIRRGGQVPLPNQDNQVQQYKVDNVQGDEVTLIDPKARRKPGQPDKVVVKRQDIEPVIKGMMGNNETK